MKRTPLRRRAKLRARKPLRRTTPLRRITPLERSKSLAASEEQRAAVAGRRCIVCRSDRRVDPAHLVPRSMGGCGDALCVVPACRSCHRAYDAGELEWELVGWMASSISLPLRIDGTPSRNTSDPRPRPLQADRSTTKDLDEPARIALDGAIPPQPPSSSRQGRLRRHGRP